MLIRLAETDFNFDKFNIVVKALGDLIDPLHHLVKVHRVIRQIHNQ